MNTMIRRRAMCGTENRTLQGFVDLGLPSGLLWAECNVGANTPEESGLYFAWGDANGHEAGAGYSFDSANYNNTSAASLTSDIPANAGYDAAANYVQGSRMPTAAEVTELIENTDQEFISTGTRGLKIMKKDNHDVYIFIPAKGYYNGTTLGYGTARGYIWTSTYVSSSRAYRLDFNSSATNANVSRDRYLGQNIRPVHDV